MARAASNQLISQVFKKLPWWAQLVVLGLIVVWVFWSAQAHPERTELQTPVSPVPISDVISEEASTAFYPVMSVVDGDTIKVNIDDRIETVRLVGVNTPETVDPRRPVECYGQEASAALKRLLQDQSVRLQRDDTQSNKDRYGRLLRFVFLPDGSDVGKQLLEQGYAQEALYSDRPHEYHEEYLLAQARAKEQSLGLWDEETCQTP